MGAENDKRKLGAADHELTYRTARAVAAKARTDRRKALRIHGKLRAERERQEFMVLCGKTPTMKAREKLGRLEALARQYPNPLMAIPREPSRSVFDETLAVMGFGAGPSGSQAPLGGPFEPEARKGMGSIANHHARASRLGVVSTLTESEWQRIVDSQDSRCLYCEKATWLTVEHIIPVSVGGPNSAANVVGVCLACNTSKGPKDLVDWLDEKGIDVDTVFRRLDASRDRLGYAS